MASSYTSLQDIIGGVVSGERTRIIDLLNAALTPEISQQLRSLFEADEQVYDISALKSEARLIYIGGGWAQIAILVIFLLSLHLAIWRYP